MGFENKYYLEATKYVDQTWKITDTVNAGYTRDTFTSRSDNAACVMINTVIAMTTQLHDRLDEIEKRVISIDQQITNLRKSTQEKDDDINQLTDKISSLNLGPADPDSNKNKKTKISFLTFKKLDTI